MIRCRCVYANSFSKVICQTSKKFEEDGTITKSRLWFVYPIDGFHSMDEVLIYESEVAAVSAAESAMHFHNVLKLKGVIK